MRNWQGMWVWDNNMVIENKRLGELYLANNNARLIGAHAKEASQLGILHRLSTDRRIDRLRAWWYYLILSLFLSLLSLSLSVFLFLFLALSLLINVIPAFLKSSNHSSSRSLSPGKGSPADKKRGPAHHAALLQDNAKERGGKRSIQQEDLSHPWKARG